MEKSGEWKPAKLLYEGKSWFCDRNERYLKQKKREAEMGFTWVNGVLLLAKRVESLDNSSKIWFFFYIYI